jgi:hypothetical protein
MKTMVPTIMSASSPLALALAGYVGDMSETCRKDPDFNNPETKFLCQELPTQPYHPQPQPCCSAASPLSCHRHPSPATAAATRSK